MISIDRQRIPLPDAFSSDWLTALRREASDFFIGSESLPPTKRQRRYQFKLDQLVADVRPALMALFHGKCAFCEYKFPETATAKPVVDHFRPKSTALNLDGTLDPDHYWWLVYEWDNLYLSCRQCSMAQGTRFPVEGARADFSGGPDALRSEAYLLLDPCHDTPEDHLVYSEDGLIASDTDRGRITIEVFGLNRDDLVQARRATYEALQAAWQRREQLLAAGETPPEALSAETLTAPYLAHAGLRRQFVTRWLQSADDSGGESLIVDSAPNKYGWSPQEQRYYSSEEQAATVDSYAEYSKTVDTYNLEEEDSAESYYLRSRLVERIELTNFKLFDHLSLKPPLGAGDATAWLVLLGENGTGKSSVLQAIALALAGGTYRDNPPLTPQEVLRHGAESGSIKVFLTGGSEPIEVAFSRDSTAFAINTPEPKMLILAYGATRLLPRHGNSQPPAPAFARIDNLFNPFVPLKEAAAWLTELDDMAFEYVARSLRDLLSLGDNDQLVRDSDDVWAEIGGQRVQLEQLSDGYQSVLALATDIMSVMLTRWESMEVAEGIVLIDEIGSHLHPRWQMRIVSSLRTVFPRIQFIVSTHNPLCLRGLHDGEVVVMRRNGQNRIIPLDDLPSHEGLRVDQLLISEHFGLNSTIDPEIERLFDEYHALLAQRSRSSAENERVAELKAALSKYSVMGDTPREKLMLEAIDRYIADVKMGAAESEPTELDDKTRTIMSDLWSKAKF